jgi:hypothetical protein
MEAKMSAQDIRTWLGTYVLVLTAVLGAYLQLAGGSWLLPLENEDVTSSFEIVIPFLLTQVVIVYKFYTTDRTSNRAIPGMPGFLVKAPFALVTGILIITFATMAVGGRTGSRHTPSAAQFKGIVTFVVALLNASSVFVVARYFESKGSDVAASSQPPP